MRTYNTNSKGNYSPQYTELNIVVIYGNTSEMSLISNNEVINTKISYQTGLYIVPHSPPCGGGEFFKGIKSGEGNQTQREGKGEEREDKKERKEEKMEKREKKKRKKERKREKRKKRKKINDLKKGRRGRKSKDRGGNKSMTVELYTPLLSDAIVERISNSTMDALRHKVEIITDAGKKKL